MDSVKDILDGLKDFLSWAASYLPPGVTLGWVILGALGVLALGYLINSWRTK